VYAWELVDSFWALEELVLQRSIWAVACKGEQASAHSDLRSSLMM
jgi:hypothetical protein